MQFINEFDEAEAGVDGGGLFKDFIENLVQEAYDPARQLFRATPQEQLYPNPAALVAVEIGAALLAFMGRMLAKARLRRLLRLFCNVQRRLFVRVAVRRLSANVLQTVLYTIGPQRFVEDK